MGQHHTLTKPRSPPYHREPLLGPSRRSRPNPQRKSYNAPPAPFNGTTTITKEIKPTNSLQYWTIGPHSSLRASRSNRPPARLCPHNSTTSITTDGNRTRTSKSVSTPHPSRSTHLITPLQPRLKGKACHTHHSRLAPQPIQTHKTLPTLVRRTLRQATAAPRNAHHPRHYSRRRGHSHTPSHLPLL
jgi:hypothetical protein